jgi:hypothetical protein
MSPDCMAIHLLAILRLSEALQGPKSHPIVSGPASLVEEYILRKKEGKSETETERREKEKRARERTARISFPWRSLANA